MIRRLLLLLVLACASSGAFAQTFSTVRTSGPNFYVDNTNAILCSYVSYQVTNTSGTNAPDVWVDIGSFTGTYINAAPSETRVVHLGALAPGQMKPAYFYLCSTTIPTNPDPLVVSESHTVRVLSNAPNLSPTVYSSNVFTITQMRDAIEANSNKVTVVVAGPNPPTTGGIITITVTGSTGSIGSPPFIYFTPASLSSWPADKFKMLSSTVSLTGGNTMTLNDQLFVNGINGSDTAYTAVYSFVALGTTTVTVPVLPINYISSGTQVKHTDTSGLAALSPIQPVSSSLQVLKFANVASLPATGGAVTYTLRVINNSSGSVSIDQFVDNLPTSPGAGSVVAGTSRWNGVLVANPFVSGSTATWSGTFTVAGGSQGNLTFDVLLPATAGVYTNSGFGRMGSSTQVDSTFTTGDNAPSSVTTRVYSAPTFTKEFSPNAIPPSGISTLTFTIVNPNPVAVSGVQFADSLPQAPGSMAVAAAPFATTSNCGSPTWAPVAGATSVSFTNGSIAANTTCVITVNVTAATPGLYTNTSGAMTATESGSSGTATNTLTVTTKPGIVKSFAPDTIPVNGISRLTLLVANNMASPLTGLAFSDPLPAGIRIAATPNLANTCGGTPTIPAPGATGTISLSAGTLAGSGSCSLAVDVTSITAGSHTNVASGVASTETGAAGPGSPPEVLVVLLPASIAKAFSPTSASVGQASTLTFTITNPNASRALTGVAFTDNLPNTPGAMVVAAPSNLTVANCGALATASATGATITLSNATVAASGTCTVAVNVTAPAAGTYNNVSGAVTSTNGGTGNTAAASLTVNTAPSIVKSFNPTSIPTTGTPATFSTATFAVTNNAAVNITSVLFTDALPSGLVVAPTPTATTTCGGTVETSANGTTWGAPTAGHIHVRLTGGAINAGVTCNVTIRMTSSAPAVYNNTTSGVTSSINATAGNPSNTAQLAVLSPAVTVTKGFLPSPVGVNAATNLTFTITNPNTVAVSGVSLRDDFPITPGAMTVANATVSNTCGGTVETSTNLTTWTAPTVGHRAIRLTGATVAANTTCLLTVSIRANTAGQYSNISQAITAVVGGFTYTGNTAGALLTVNTSPSISKSFSPTTTTVGASAQLSIVVSNGAAGSMTAAEFTDIFPTSPSQMTYVGTVSNGCGGTLVDSAGGALAPGDVGIRLTGATVAGLANCTIIVNVTGTAPGSYANQAGAVTASTGTGSASNTAVLTLISPPSIAKAFSSSGMGLSGTATLTLTLTNPAANSVTLTGLAVTDPFPAGLQVAAVPGFSNTCGGAVAPGSAAGDTSIALTGGSLAPGASCTVQVNVTATTAGTKVNTTGAVTSTNGGTGNTGTATINVVGAATVAKAFSVPTTSTGNTVVLTITITNPAGNGVAQTGVGITDSFPAGLQVAAAPALTNTCGGSITSGSVAGETALTLAGGSVAAGASCQVQVTLLATSTGVKNNTTGAVSSDNGGTGNTASASVTVLSPLTATKVFAPASIGVGNVSQITVTLTNPNATAIAGLAFTDIFPTTPGAMTLFDTTTGNTCAGTLEDGAGGALNAGDVGLRLTGGALGAGTSCQVTFNVTAAVAGSYTNNSGAIVSTTAGTNAGTSGALTVLQRPVVTKAFGAASVAVGGTTTLTITVTNPNPTPLTGVAFTDVFPVAPAAMTLSDATAGNTCGGTVTDSGGGAIGAGDAGVQLSGGGVGASTSCAITVNVTAAVAGDYTNTLAIGSVTTTNAGASAVAGDATVSFVQPTLAKAFGAVAIDDTGSTALVFTFTNGAGNPAQSGVGFREILPSGLRFTSAAPAVAFSAGCAGATAFSGAPTNQLDVSGLTMSGGTASCTLTITGVTNVTGQVNGSCAATPAAFTNQAANVTLPVRLTSAVTPQCLVVNARSQLTKAFGAATVGLDQVTTLAFTIDNTGAGAANRAGLSFSDALPAGLAVANPPVATTSAGCVVPTLTGTASNSTTVGASSIGVNAGNTCVVTFTVRGTTLGAKTNTAALVTVGGALVNAVTDQTVTVVQATAAKTFGAVSINDAAATTLVFTLTNGAGNPAQGGIALGDTLPAALRLNSGTPAVAYSAGCSGPAAATYSAGTRILSGLTGIAMTGGTASCTVTVAGLTNEPQMVNAACPTAAFTNLGASVTTTNAANGSADACLVVNRINPNVAKTFGAASFNDGASTTLVFTLTNQGSNPAQPSITLGDTLPSGLRFGSATPAVAYSAGCSGPANAAYDGGTRILSGLSGIAMAAGTASCTVTVAGLTNAAGQVGACASVPTTNLAASVTATNATNTSTDQCVGVNRIDPTVAKAFGAASINDGAAITLVFTLANQGTNPAQPSITLGDTLPTGLRFSGAAPAVTYSAGCTGPANAAFASGTRILSGLTGIAMANGTASCTVTVGGLTNAATQVNASCPAASFTNTSGAITATNATVLPGDACLVVNRISPSLTKVFTPVAIDAGAVSTLVLTLTNSGTNPAQSGIGVVDTLAAGLVVAGTPNVQSNCPAGGALVNNPAFVATGAGSVTVSGAAINAGVASCEIRVNVTAATAGAYTNTDAGNLSGQANVTTAGATATLTVNAVPSISKAFGAAAIGLNQATTLAFTIDNTAPGAVNRAALSFTDTLPAGLVTANPPAATTSAGCLAPTLTGTANGSGAIGASSVGVNAGQTCVVTFAVRGTTAGAKTNDSASVAVGGGLANAVTPQVLTVVQASLAKAFGAANIDDGAFTTLVFTLTNAAPSPAQAGIGFTETLPASLRFSASSIPVTYSAGCSGPATVTVTGAPLNQAVLSGLAMAGGTASCTVTLGDGTTNGVTNVAGQFNGSCVGSPAAFTNAAANVTALANVAGTVSPQCLTVASIPALTKAFAVSSLGIGQATTLTFTIANTAGGATARSGLAFTDTLPAGLAIANPPAPTTNGNCGTPAFTAADGTQPFSASAIAVAAGATCTITIGIRGTALGTATNDAANVSALTGLANAVTPQSVTVSQATLTKAFAPASIAAGATTTLTFTLANGAGNPAQAGINFTDTLPAGLRLAAVPNTQSNCPAGGALGAGPAFVSATGGGSAITVTGAAMGPGVGSCEIRVDVTTAAVPTASACPIADNTNGPGSISGIANVTNGVTNQCVTVTAVTPSLTKAFSGATLAIGATTTLTFTITQPAANPPQAFSFTDTLPAGLVISGSGAVGGSCAGGSVTATAGTAAITVANRTITGTSCTITVPITTAVVFTTGACPVAANTNGPGQVTGITNLVNNVTPQCVEVTAQAPTIAKSFTPNAISTNGVSTLLVTITNPNAAAIAVAGVTDTFPGGVVRAGTPAAATSCAGGNVTHASGSVTLTGGTVPANGSCTFQINVTASVAATYTNTIAAGALTTNAGSNATPASATLTVSSIANLAIAKSGPATVATGTAFSYSLVISNAGPDAANGATFADNVPGVVTGVGASCGAPTGGAACGAVNVAGNNVTGTVAALPSGGSVTITINGIAPATGSFTNTATVAPPAGTSDPAAGNDSSSVMTTVLAPDLTIAKTHAGNFNVGTNGVYAITVANTAGTLATSGTITVVDTLPTGLTFVSATGTGWGCVSAPPLVTCTSATPIAAGALGNPITLTVAVASTAVPGVTNTVSVSGGGEPAGLSGDNSTADFTSVGGTVANTFGPDNAQSGPPGAVLFYSHTFNANLAGTVVFTTSSAQSPAVPGWTQIIYRDTDCNGVLNGAEGTSPLTSGVAVVPGDAVCIVVKDSIPSSAPYNATNAITVTSTFNGATTISRQDVTTVGSAGGSGLVLSKSVSNITQGGPAGTSNTARPNDVLEYTVTYINTAAGVLTNIVVTDSTPAFTLYQSAACTLPLPASLTACTVTTQPAVNGTGAVVWTIAGGLNSAGSGSVTYRVRVSN